MERQYNVTVGAASGSWFLSILTVIFVIAKIAGIGIVATWSWWWVFSPIWIPFVLSLVIAVIGFIVFAIGRGLEKW